MSRSLIGTSSHFQPTIGQDRAQFPDIRHPISHPAMWPFSSFGASPNLTSSCPPAPSSRCAVSRRVIESPAGRNFLLRRVTFDVAAARVHHHHGAVGRGKVHAPGDPRHVRRRVEWRVPLPRPPRSSTGQQGTARAEPPTHRLRLPAVPPARRPDRRRKPRRAAVVPERARRTSGPQSLPTRSTASRSSGRRTCTRASFLADSSSWLASRAP